MCIILERSFTKTRDTINNNSFQSVLYSIFKMKILLHHCSVSFLSPTPPMLLLSQIHGISFIIFIYI